MSNNIINLDATGKDSIKGGIFFGSNLTPVGTFSNIPKFAVTNPLLSTQPSLVLTLQKVKDSLSLALQQQTGAESTDDVTLEKYLYEFVNLLIDYRDIRNFVFYGSANTELAYNINYLINNYPYSTLVAEPTSYNFISISPSYVVSGVEKTDVIFPETFYFSPDNAVRIIRDNFNKFNFSDDSSDKTWNNLEVEDKNGRRYPIDRVVTPYKATTIFDVSSISNITATVGIITYETILVTTVGSHGYIIGQHVSFVDLLSSVTGQLLQYVVKLFNPDTLLYDILYNYQMNGTDFVIDSVPSVGSFTIRRPSGAPLEHLAIATTYDTSNTGFSRLFPAAQNTHPYGIKLTVLGNFSDADLFNYVDEAGVTFRGFLIAPKISVLNDFQLNLTPVQNMLLSPAPINPTPWPRRIVTNNLMNITTGDDVEPKMISWLNSPSSLYVASPSDPSDVDAAWSNWGLNYEYNMIRALALDETETNQLVRRCLPADIIGERFDMDNSYFQRFILIAGWLFDNINQYSKFVEYAHTINHTKYNQLSPEYYKFLSDYWGLELFNDDSVDFSKLVVRTIPGQYYGLSQTQINDNSYLQQTLQELQYTKQKNLLYSLLFLYKQKGTQACIHKLVGLLGAPDGFLQFNEYVFQVGNVNNIGYPQSGYTGNKIIDNQKVHVPKITFEIDPDYLLDKVNVNNSINKPYVYRQFLSNEYTHNLREISLLTDPNGAVDNQVVNIFGNQRYNYVTFGKGEFSNLQKNGKFWMLPLSLPDRFYGISFDYMIPCDGFKKWIGTDQDEATCNLFSLYRISSVVHNTVLTILSININVTSTIATITTVGSHLYTVGSRVYVSNTTGLNNINDRMFTVSTTPDGTTFTIDGDFTGSWTGGGHVVLGTLRGFNNTGTDPVMYTYPLAVQYAQSNRDIDTSFAVDNHSNVIVDGYTNPSTDFDILYKRYPSSIYIDDTYVITRLEGNDLVTRLRLKSEISSTYFERVAIMENVFSPDGLNHSLRMVLRENGIEIYKDYVYVGIALWMDPAFAGSYHPYEIPKYEIQTLLRTADPCSNSFSPLSVTALDSVVSPSHSGTDALNWWDLFVGMPEGVDIYFKKFNFFQNDTVNAYNIGDKITGSNNETAEFYIFEVANPTVDSRIEEEVLNFDVPAVTYHMTPNNMPIGYNYEIPQSQDGYGRNVTLGLSMTNKRCYHELKNGLKLNKKQSFFRFDDVFGNNAWMRDIHKSYYYDLFDGELIKLYELYSSQVLTYEELEPFMELIEQKLKSTFTSFIPIVVNVFEFGRAISNSIFKQAKMRLPGSNKICTAQIGPSPSVVTTYVFGDVNGPGVSFGSSFSWTIYNDIGSIITNGSIASSGVDEFFDLLLLKDDINAAGWGSHIVADVYSMQLRIKIDYDWFLSTYGSSPNLNTLVLREFGGGTPHIYHFHDGVPMGMGVHTDTLDTCGTIVTYAYNDYDVCGSVTYTLPSLTPRPVYVYYESEGRPPLYVHFSTEFSDPVIVHFNPVTEP